jgi:hypothetical protein
MGFRDFIIFYSLTISFINFIAVLLSLVFGLECIKFFLATLLLTNFILLFYSYLSVDIHEQMLSFV